MSPLKEDEVGKEDKKRRADELSGKRVTERG